MNIRRAFATTALSLLVFTASSFAQTLTNGTFETNTDGWSADSGASLVWSSTDANNSAASGSAFVTNVNPSSNSSATASQCLPVMPNFQYTAAGSIRIPSGQARGRAALSLAWYSDGGCTAPISSVSTGAVRPTNKWFVKSTTATAPAAAVAVKVQLRVLKQAAGVLGANFDDITLTGTPGNLGFSSASYSAGEGNGTLELTVVRTVGSLGAVSVDYAASNGTATSGSDFDLANGTLFFADGEISKTITVAISDDAIVEGDENFTVTLSNVTGGAGMGAISVATASIIENDVPIPGTVQFDLTSISANEDAGLVTLYLTRTNGVAGMVSVDYATSDGTAVAGDDYTGATGSVVFADGQSSQSITIQLTADAIVEADETFSITLSNPQGGALLGGASTANVTISNDDLPAGDISFTLASYSVAETAGIATFAGVITRSGGTSGDISATLSSTDITATSALDYTAINETITFLDGDDTPEDVTVVVADDFLAEADEVLALTLSNATGGAQIGPIPTAGVTILDNDSTNVRPTIAALGPVNLVRGNGVTTAVATVSDNETSAGSLVVSAATPNGITVSSFSNSGGSVSATVSALCSVTPGEYTAVLTVTDGSGGTDSADLVINVSASAAPAISSVVEVPINSTGHTASVIETAGSSYQWFITNGSAVGGATTPTFTYGAGAPGSTMVLQVIETPASGCVTATGSKKVSVDFLDVGPGHGLRSFVNTIARNYITGGCGGGNYCPDNSITRAQMAVFILRAKYGETYVPADAVGLFNDVPTTSGFARWIEALYNDGVTGGCGSSNYCPDNAVSRQEMAVFLIAAKYGNATLPEPVGVFSDVPVSSPYAKFVEKLVADGVTAGCGNGLYCPDSANTRGQMAVFLDVTFNLQ